MMKDIHSYWAYIVLALLVFAVFNAIASLTKKKEFTDNDLRIGLFTLIVTHIQFLIGLGWYFSSPWYKSMKLVGVNQFNRLYVIEHPIIMILAITFITIGWSKHKKKNTSEGKFKMFAIFYGIGLLLMLSRIPWQNWIS